MMYFLLQLTTPVAHAATAFELLKKINKYILNPVIVLLFTLALVVFIFGVMQYLLNPVNDEERERGQSHILWGIVGMAIMVSVWGIMTIIVNTLGIDYINEGNIRGGEVHIEYE